MHSLINVYQVIHCLSVVFTSRLRGGGLCGGGHGAEARGVGAGVLSGGAGNMHIVTGNEILIQKY